MIGIPLSQKATFGWPFCFSAPCAGDSKGRACGAGTLRIDQLVPLRGSPARLRRAFVVLIRVSAEPASTAPSASVRVRIADPTFALLLFLTSLQAA